MSKIRPLHSYIVVQPTAVKEMSVNGIVIPEVVAEKPQVGIVTAVGPESVLDVNCTVLYTKNAGQEVKIDNETFIVMLEDEIVTVIEPE